MNDPWTDRLSEYLDGHLSADEAEAIRVHVEGCRECSTTLEELASVVRAAHNVVDRPPPRDLWPVIARGLRAQETDVLSLADRRNAIQATARMGGRARWQVRLSVPQLVAAGLALVLFSGGGVWMVGRGAPAAGSPAAMDVPLPEADGERVPASLAESPAGPDLSTFAAEVEALEEVLGQYRDRLDPRTIRVLEKNLAVIDRAIEDSRRALEVDPGNPYVLEHLNGSMQRKLAFLRETARLAERAS